MKTHAVALEKQMIAVCRSLYDQGFISGSEGNASVRLGENRILITPAGTHKGHLSKSQILPMDIHGKVLNKKSKLKLSTERFFHLALYHHVKNCRAILHAHPPFTIALSLAGFDFNRTFLAETPYALGVIAQLPYTLPSSEKLGAAIGELVQKTQPKNTIVMERHGAITFGESFMEALTAMEILEKTAKIVFLAKAIGADYPMSPQEAGELAIHLRGLR